MCSCPSWKLSVLIPATQASTSFGFPASSFGSGMRGVVILSVCIASPQDSTLQRHTPHTPPPQARGMSMPCIAAISWKCLSSSAMKDQSSFPVLSLIITVTFDQAFVSVVSVESVILLVFER
jgi:hypothetical protein